MGTGMAQRSLFDRSYTQRHQRFHQEIWQSLCHGRRACLYDGHSVEWHGLRSSLSIPSKDEHLYPVWAGFSVNRKRRRAFDWLCHAAESIWTDRSAGMCGQLQPQFCFQISWGFDCLHCPFLDQNARINQGPTVNGWQKRLSFAISPPTNTINEDREISISAGVLQGCHDFQLRGPFQHCLHVCPDGFALAILRTVGKAIRNWCDSKIEHGEIGEIINRYFLTKIQFYGTDITRFAFAIMRQELQQQADIKTIAPGHTDCTQKKFYQWNRSGDRNVSPLTLDKALCQFQSL